MVDSFYLNGIRHRQRQRQRIELATHGDLARATNRVDVIAPQLAHLCPRWQRECIVWQELVARVLEAHASIDATQDVMQHAPSR